MSFGNVLLTFLINHVGLR